MKILIFNWRDIRNPKAGGAETFIHEIAKRWVATGDKVTLLTSSFSSNLVKKECIDSVEVIRTGDKYSVYLKGVRYYKKYLKGRYDVIIDAVNTFPFFTPFYTREPKIALIFQMTQEVYFRLFPKPFAFLLSKGERLLFRIYKKIPIIVLSESIKKELVNFGFKKGNIAVISPGVDQKIKKEVRKESHPTILYLNRVIKYKNVDDLIKAFSLVKRKIPEAKLLIVGCRGGRYEAYLKRLVEKLNLSGIEFYPFVIDEKKEEFLRSSWIHVLPSTKEGFGISVLEAGMHAIPSIGYNVTGLRDAIKPNRTGMLVPLRNIEALSEAIITLLRNNDLRKKLGENAKEYAKQFDWYKSAQQSRKILRDIANAK